MIKIPGIALFAVTHTAAVAVGFALGIYALPILIAPDNPADETVQTAAGEARFTGTFHRELADSDALHWGEGMLFITADTVVFAGELAPGPDYRLYLSPQFVETETEFEALKSSMIEVGHVRTFENFMIPIPHTVNPADFSAAIVWCETFGQFITAATYQ